MPEFYYEYEERANLLKCEIYEISNELSIEEMYIAELMRKLDAAREKLEELMEVFA